MESVRQNLPHAPRPSDMAAYRPPMCFELVGQKFDLVMDDGYEYSVEFTGRDTLCFGRADKDKMTCEYDCVKPEDETYFIIFESNASEPRTGVTLLLDMEQSLVTMNFCWKGWNPRYPKMTKSRLIFGAIRKSDGSLNPRRHGYTRDLVGKSIKWTYGPLQGMIHCYSSERYYRLKVPPEALEAQRKKDPEHVAMREKWDAIRLYEDKCEHVKIKDGLYLVNVDEQLICIERGSGNNLCYCIDLNRMRNTGRSFGHDGQGMPENYIYGAVGEWYDASDMHERKSTQYIR